MCVFFNSMTCISLDEKHDGKGQFFFFKPTKMNKIVGFLHEPQHNRLTIGRCKPQLRRHQIKRYI